MNTCKVRLSEYSNTWTDDEWLTLIPIINTRSYNCLHSKLVYN